METERDQFKISKKKKTNNESCNSHILRPNEIRYAQKDARPSKSTSDEIELRRTTSRHYFYFWAQAVIKIHREKGRGAERVEKRTNSFVNGFPLFKIRMGCNGW